MVRARIALTGGSNSGKSAIQARAVERFGSRVRAIPEAALDVFQRRGVETSELDDATRRILQTDIFRLQRNREDDASRTSPRDVVLLMDRGTVDCAAYWPEGPNAFWSAMGTSAKRELGRYDHVLWLQTAAAIGVFDRIAATGFMREPAVEAIALGERILELWRPHPALVIVPASSRFEDKVATALDLIRLVMTSSTGVDEGPRIS